MPEGTRPMSEQPPNYDPVAVILARMETKLDNALTEQARHGTALDRHDRILNEHGNRLTAVETTTKGMPEQIDVLASRKYVSPAALGWAIGTAIACLGVLITFLAIYGHTAR